jgi:hypothetical protein
LGRYHPASAGLYLCYKTSASAGAVNDPPRTDAAAAGIFPGYYAHNYHNNNQLILKVKPNLGSI